MEEDKLRLDIILKGEDMKAYLSNFKNLGFKKHSKFVKSATNKEFIYVNLYMTVANLCRKIGVNINQIARHFNTHSHIEKSVLLTMSSQLDTIIKNQNDILAELRKHDTE